MTKYLSKILFCVVSVFLISIAVAAQDTPSVEPKPSETPPIADGAKDGRQGMLMQIGLTRDQFRQLRQFNARHRPIMTAAQQRLREATVALDDAIYADTLAEGEFESK
nr:hypothetical protein [Pyrinomonadaceae bacterium]